MKKIFLILLILVIAALPVTLAACSRASQASRLSSGYVCTENGYERFTYTLFMEEAQIGNMTMQFNPLSAKAIDMPAPATEGSRHFENVTGTLLETNVQVETGDSVSSAVLYDSAFSPIYSYKKMVVGEVTREMQVVYEDKYAYTKYFENGEETDSAELKFSSGYDNEMLYAIVRASIVNDSSYSFTYNTPNARISDVEGMAITKGDDTAVKVPFLNAEESIPCYSFTISTDNAFAGNYRMTIAKDHQKVTDNAGVEVAVRKVITSITEGKYKYNLTEVEIQ